MVNPSDSSCHGCSFWDNLNGCYKRQETVEDCDLTEGLFFSEELMEESRYQDFVDREEE